MTTLNAQMASTREALDPALESWRFLWVPLTARFPVAPAQPADAAVARLSPPPPTPSPTATALTVIEAVPERFAQASMPAVVAAYRQNAD